MVYKKQTRKFSKKKRKGFKFRNSKKRGGFFLNLFRKKNDPSLERKDNWFTKRFRKNPSTPNIPLDRKDNWFTRRFRKRQNLVPQTDPDLIERQIAVNNLSESQKINIYSKLSPDQKRQYLQLSSAEKNQLLFPEQVNIYLKEKSLPNNTLRTFYNQLSENGKRVFISLPPYTQLKIMEMQEKDPTRFEFLMSLSPKTASIFLESEKYQQDKYMSVVIEAKDIKPDDLPMFNGIFVEPKYFKDIDLFYQNINVDEQRRQYYLSVPPKQQLAFLISCIEAEITHRDNIKQYGSAVPESCNNMDKCKEQKYKEFMSLFTETDNQTEICPFTYQKLIALAECYNSDLANSEKIRLITEEEYDIDDDKRIELLESIEKAILWLTKKVNEEQQAFTTI